MSANNGGPAFPRTGYFDPNGPAEADCEPQDGMSLRDYFAAEALAALVGNEAARERLLEDARNARRMLYAETARAAYEMADAMLVARLPASPVLQAKEGREP